MDLVDVVYDTTETWPRDETFGLKSQARRAAVSIPSNIAEGRGRSGSAEFAHHLSIAHGSLCEIETLLRIGHRRGYVDDAKLSTALVQAGEIRRLMLGLMRKLRSLPSKPPPASR
ncbi:MAG TPA: four helix bundle protein [Thermomicrobiales bacterium]|nr:four helix bundle protein [Thermomicrobiales bacterium]